GPTTSPRQETRRLRKHLCLPPLSSVATGLRAGRRRAAPPKRAAARLRRALPARRPVATQEEEGRGRLLRLRVHVRSSGCRRAANPMPAIDTALLRWIVLCPLIGCVLCMAGAATGRKAIARVAGPLSVLAA